MARRSKDRNVGLAQDLRDSDFAREFLVAAIEEGVSIQIALGKATPSDWNKGVFGENRNRQSKLSCARSMRATTQARKHLHSRVRGA